MIRLFDLSKQRKISNLDKLWSFVPDENDIGIKEKWYADFPRQCTKIYVPGSWNTEFEMENYIGAAWYKTTFELAKENAKLVFGAVNNNCIVYVDKKQICVHDGGFGEFSFILHGIKAGIHELVVRVDNTQNDTDTIPLERVDWFNHGGIMRSVEVHEFDNVLIDNIKIDYDADIAKKTAQLHITAEIYSEISTKETLSISVDEKDYLVREVALSTGNNCICSDFQIENIEAWDIDNPRLYLFKVSCGNDDLYERSGFRTIEIKNGCFFLNGKKIKFKGVNRHEEYPGFGFAVPFKLIKKDIDIISDMGCNVIRGSHYPNSKATLDYLDEKGLLFWEEIPMWGFPEEPLKNEKVIEQGTLMHSEMVKRDFNHPCIIIWGLHNEIATETKAAYEISERFIKTLRAYDKKRLITYASMKPFEDICFELADFISLNKYIGWYEGSLSSWVEFLDKFHSRLKELNCDSKPLVITEFGAGGIAGNISFEKLRWTENYQDDALSYMVDLFLKREDIAGMFIWQFADLRTSHAMELERPRSYNNKGILNEYRKPKMAYYSITKLFHRY